MPFSSLFLKAITRQLNFSVRQPGIWVFLWHEVRPSNLFVVSQSRAGESEQSRDEKRYKELNQKYDNGTIAEQEERELVDIQHALDKADANDPQLMSLSKDVDAGYDRLHNGLSQINKILDELLAT